MALVLKIKAQKEIETFQVFLDIDNHSEQNLRKNMFLNSCLESARYPNSSQQKFKRLSFWIFQDLSFYASKPV